MNHNIAAGASGRLALRVENPFWNAYFAKPDSMDDALLLGSIHMSGVADHDARARAFITLMRDFVSDLIGDATGARPTWPDGPEPAPEHERWEALQSLANGRLRRCIEFAKALQMVRDNSRDPAAVSIAIEALRMPHANFNEAP